MSQTIISIVISFIASTGFWAFLTRFLDRKNAFNRIVLGLAHDRIISLGEQYVERGYITVGEYENLHDYLYLPYKAGGGNGTAEKVMKEVDKLPIRDN